MTDVIKSKLKERSYLTEIYYKCSKRKPDVKKLIVKTNECVEIISAVKDRYVIQMFEKLNDPLQLLKFIGK